MTEELDSIIEYSINLKDQEAPAPLPVGRYVGTIRGAEKKESQRGTLYAAVSFFVGSDQYPVDFTDGNDDGLTLVHRRVSLEDNPQARHGARRFCEAIGAPLGKKIDLNDWIGTEAMLEVDHDTYEGVTRAVINRVHPL